MKTIISKSTITKNLKQTAKSIDEYYQNINSPLLVVPILNGGVFFFVDLVRELKTDTEMGVISIKHYDKAEVPLEELKLRFEDVNVRDRHVLLVDEICFTGKTFKKVKDRFLLEEAKEVKSIALVDHEREGRVHEPDWHVVSYTGDLWLWGQGMDKDGLQRDLEDIVA